jgi:Predicted flavoprotein involved in K+ transport
MIFSTEVAIIGAGPYGLSLAAHLKGAAVPFRIFGRPMDSWREHMPKGMLLKSDGFASNLSDPESSFTLEHFCRQEGVEYHPTDMPVGLDAFTAYGLAFQKRFAPELEEKLVTSVECLSGGFRLKLEDHDQLTARRVAVAAGITHFPYLPPELEHIPAKFLTHSFAHGDLERFRGARVAVVGAGASALDLAALLNEQGATAHLIARQTKLAFHGKRAAGRRPLWKRVRQPSTGIGPGLRSFLYVEYPNLFRQLPANVRLNIVKTHLGPAAGWPTRDRVLGCVSLSLGFQIARAEISGEQVHLRLIGPDNVEADHFADRVIAATGYRADLRGLPFLNQDVLLRIRCLQNAPILSGNFESSLPGLYFLGLASANSFGPLMRFAYGAEYTTRKIAKHLARRK